MTQSRGRAIENRTAEGGKRVTTARLSAALACALLVGQLPLAASEPAAKPPHLEAAEELVKHVLPADSSYRHKRGTVLWKGSHDAARYESHTDCSGLLNHLLAHCYGIKSDDLRAWLGTARPTAKTYYEAVAAQNGFSQIARLEQVRDGDIIAIKYPPGADDTGHVMIVAGAARRRAATAPEVQGTQQWEVLVIDSATSGHGKTDSRHKPDRKYNPGIGKGALRLYTDQQGKLVGYTWSTYSGSVYRAQSAQPVVIGRLLSEKLARPK
jgi:hypothetical protein